MPDWPAMLDTVGQALSYGLLRVILPLILIAVLAIVALRLVAVAAAAIDKRVIDPVQDDDRRARLQTLRKASKSTAQMVIAAIAVLIGLGTIGVDIGPALAAAGIFGLAISLGAQTLIKDIIGGLTILLEDEYRVGDAIRIGSVIGDVERITLRRTDLRDAEGRLFMVPNGEVRTVANETRDWARAGRAKLQLRRRHLQSGRSAGWRAGQGSGRPAGQATPAGCARDLRLESAQRLVGGRPAARQGDGWQTGRGRTRHAPGGAGGARRGRHGCRAESTA